MLFASNCFVGFELVDLFELHLHFSIVLVYLIVLLTSCFVWCFFICCEFSLVNLVWVC